MSFSPTQTLEPIIIPSPHNMAFRNIEEGEGGTLPIAHHPPLVGTYYLMTCVGVYFRADKDRCFFAHIDARSAEFESHAMVTKRAGEEIAEQVRLRLRYVTGHILWIVQILMDPATSSRGTIGT